jgi:hypothetical protein
MGPNFRDKSPLHSVFRVPGTTTGILNHSVDSPGGIRQAGARQQHFATAIIPFGHVLPSGSRIRLVETHPNLLSMLPRTYAAPAPAKSQLWVENLKSSSLSQPIFSLIGLVGGGQTHQRAVLLPRMRTWKCGANWSSRTSYRHLNSLRSARAMERTLGSSPMPSDEKSVSLRAVSSNVSQGQVIWHSMLATTGPRWSRGHSCRRSTNEEWASRKAHEQHRRRRLPSCCQTSWLSICSRFLQLTCSAFFTIFYNWLVPRFLQLTCSAFFTIDFDPIFWGSYTTIHTCSKNKDLLRYTYTYKIYLYL